jgi:hypothetical protein
MRPVSIKRLESPRPQERKSARCEHSAPRRPTAITTHENNSVMNNGVMPSAKAEPSKRQSVAWLAVTVMSAAVLIYGAFVVLNLVGLR